VAFLAQLADELPSLEPGATGRETAYAVRLVQMRLSQAAPGMHGGVVGQDQLTPLFERVVVAARPKKAWSLLAKMKEIPESELLRKPDLASAVDGWHTACSGIEELALASWHTARRQAIFWRTMGGGKLGQPPANVLRQAVCQGPSEPLTHVFRGFVAHLEDLEDEAGGDQNEFQRLVSEMLPTGFQV